MADTRPLMNDEITMATRVFQQTVPYNRVVLSNDLGLFDHPYTTPDWFNRGQWVIHFGPR